MLLSGGRGRRSLPTLPLLHLLELHLGVPSLLQFLDLKELSFSLLVLFLLKHSVESFDFNASGLLFLRFLRSRGLDIVYIRLYRRERVAERSDSSLNQILNLLWNLDLIIVVDDLLVCLQRIHRVGNLMSKLESAFLLLLENVWADYELLGCCLDRGKLLITNALSGLGQGCVVVVADEEAIGELAACAVVLPVWRAVFVLRCLQGL